mmetsp:Transcript_9407/g.27768  ORF Transcript_9407/g.27768 Transcript_9407/m.27768 type:complete len:313 (-) Transcript_9407:309-1247(-)
MASSSVVPDPSPALVESGPNLRTVVVRSVARAVRNWCSETSAAETRAERSFTAAARSLSTSLSRLSSSDNAESSAACIWPSRMRAPWASLAFSSKCPTSSVNCPTSDLCLVDVTPSSRIVLSSDTFSSDASSCAALCALPNRSTDSVSVRFSLDLRPSSSSVCSSCLRSLICSSCDLPCDDWRAFICSERVRFSAWTTPRSESSLVTSLLTRSSVRFRSCSASVSCRTIWPNCMFSVFLMPSSFMIASSSRLASASARSMVRSFSSAIRSSSILACSAATFCSASAVLAPSARTRASADARSAASAASASAA